MSVSDETARELVRALYSVLFEMHPVYSSTAGRGGGIGGQALTPGCLINHPYTDQEIESYEKMDKALRTALTEIIESDGMASAQELHGYGIPHPQRSPRRQTHG